MNKKKKKQHYVPRFYLEQWSIPNKYQVYVYNKKEKRSYVASIYDVASEHFFYDIDFTRIFSENNLKGSGSPVGDSKSVADEQFIENYFADKIEADFKDELRKVTSRVARMNAWEIENCHFLPQEGKNNLSFHLALQLIRVKYVRSSLTEMDDCLKKALEDMGASKDTINKFLIPKSQLSYVHGQMIMDDDMITCISNCFSSLTWILYVNKSEKLFFTSDNPIGRESHMQHPYLSMNGLLSPGIEVYFPLSPNLMLLMFDGNFHTNLRAYDRRIIELKGIEFVDFYNTKCILESENCVFSKENDFSIISEMLESDPNILEQPKILMRWNGNTYTPKKRESKETNSHV